MGDKLKRIFAFAYPNVKLNRSLRILMVTNAIMVFIIGLLAPFYAVFVQDIGGSIAFAGLSWAVFSIVAGLLIFLFSNWELKVKETELLVALGYILRGGVFLSYAYMTSLPQLIATQVLWGIAVAISIPAFDSLYSEHTDRDGAIVEWGDREGSALIASGVAALIGGVVIQTFGYEVIFLAMAFISFCLGIYIWRLPRDLL